MDWQKLRTEVVMSMRLSSVLLVFVLLFGCAANETKQPSAAPPALTDTAPAPGDVVVVKGACFGEDAGETMAAGVETTSDVTPEMMALFMMGVCREFEPATMVIDRVIRALVDWEGDVAFLVQARFEGKPVEIYTVVWPHHLIALPEQMRGQPI